jgi:gamma-glutamyl hydrolase
LECSSQQQPLALNLTEDYFISNFAKQTPDDVTDILSTQNVTVNFHSQCLTPENFARFETLQNFWYVLSTNKDWDGVEFISLMEAKHYPMWGSQYHPEKNSYEWTPKYPNIPHFKDAIHASAHQAEFFVQVSIWY